MTGSFCPRSWENFAGGAGLKTAGAGWLPLPAEEANSGESRLSDIVAIAENYSKVTSSQVFA